MAKRYKQFAFITYPESMGDIYQRIQDLGIQAVRSPIHDSDYTEHGEIKKAHFHNIILFSSLKSRDQIDTICALLGIVYWEEVYDLRGALRYMCHLDCSDDSGKTKYSPSDVLTFGGFNYSICLDDAEKESPYLGVLRFISEYNLKDFRELVNVVMEKKPQYLNYLVDKAYFFNLYVRPRDQN